MLELRVFGFCPLPYILKNTTFQELDLFQSSGEGWETLSLLYESVSERCVCWMMEEVQKPSNPECHEKSSKQRTLALYLLKHFANNTLS
jgi:hypothetical protein